MGKKISIVASLIFLIVLLCIAIYYLSIILSLPQAEEHQNFYDIKQITYNGVNYKLTSLGLIGERWSTNKSDEVETVKIYTYDTLAECINPEYACTYEYYSIEGYDPRGFLRCEICLRGSRKQMVWNIRITVCKI